MNSKIDLKAMKEVYGKEIYDIILSNIVIIEKNLKYLRELKFDDYVGIFERCPIIFTYFPKDFKRKIDGLIKSLGSNYVEIIESNINLIEELL